MKPITISKKVLFSETYTVGEFIEVLKDPQLEHSTNIQISTRDDHEMLSAIYKCRFCDEIHLLGAKNNFLKRRKVEKYLYQHAKNVYGNTPDMHKSEVISILETLDKDTKMRMETINYKDSFTITGVYKCGSDGCPVIHLDCSYDGDAPNLN